MKNEINTGDVSLKKNSTTGSGGVGVEFHNNSDNVSCSGMNDQILTSVPYIVHESAMARGERHIKRLVVALIISIAALFLSNIGWIWYLSQYDFSDESIEINADSGNANYIGQNGDIYNGKD